MLMQLLMLQKFQSLDFIQDMVSCLKMLFLQKKYKREDLIWIGPGSEIISKMGDKLEGRNSSYSVLKDSNFTKNL